MGRAAVERPGTLKLLPNGYGDANLGPIDHENRRIAPRRVPAYPVPSGRTACHDHDRIVEPHPGCVLDLASQPGERWYCAEVAIVASAIVALPSIGRVCVVPLVTNAAVRPASTGKCAP